MSDTNAARRYARALVHLAAEDDQSDAISTDLARLVELLHGEGSELFEVLRNPAFTLAERAEVLQAVLPRLGVQPATRNFLLLLNERGRASLLPEIERIVREMLDERAGRIRVEVATVEPLTPQLENELRTAFESATGKTVVLDARIDPSLIGGLQARIGGRVYDASIRARLEDMKHRLINAPAAPEA